MKNAGFTLMELMIAIALGVILLGIGIPSLSNLLGSNNLATQEKSLLNHLNYARQQAISNQQTVTLCLTTTNGTDEECVTGGATRLLVFIDSDRDQKLNGSETTLTASPEFPAQLTISADTHSADLKSLRFLPDGTLASVNKVTFSLCVSGEKGIEIDVMPAGRAHNQASGAVCP